MEMSRIESKSIDQRLPYSIIGLNEDLKVVARSLDRPLSRPFPTEKGPVHLLLSLRSGLLPLHAEEECLTPLLFDRQLLLMRVNLSRPTLSIRALDMGGPYYSKGGSGRRSVRAAHSGSLPQHSMQKPISPNHLFRFNIPVQGVGEYLLGFNPLSAPGQAIVSTHPLKNNWCHIRFPPSTPPTESKSCPFEMWGWSH